MYRILVVDDEYIERQGLKKILNSHFDGILEISEAETGKEAIEVAYLKKPDIVFMDMKMPGMDGIEAIEEIQKISPSSKFAIVSAYDSFHYAQKAINIEVCEYLLKPVKRKSIIAVVEKLIEIKSHEISKIKQELDLKSKLSDILPFIENEMVQSIANSDLHKKNMINNLDLLKFSGINCFAIIVEFYEDDFNRLESPIEKNILKQEIEDYIYQNLKEEFSCIIGNLINNKVFAFIEIEEDIENLSIRNYSIELLRRLRENIKTKFEIRAKIGIGGIAPVAEELYQSFKEATIAIKYNSIDAKVIHFEDINIDNTYRETYPIDVERELIEKLQLGIIDETKQAYDKLMDWIFLDSVDNALKKLYLLELRAILNRTLGEKLGDQYEPISFEVSLISRVDQETLFKLRKNMYMHIATSLEKLNCKREEQFDYIINDAKKFIEENYIMEITLEEVAHYMNFSPYYFSKLFKKQTGINFIDFLTNIRMEKAKELINIGELSMKEIANKVGYKDPNYFSRVFKKNVGINPREYKR